MKLAGGVYSLIISSLNQLYGNFNQSQDNAYNDSSLIMDIENNNQQLSETEACTINSPTSESQSSRSSSSDGRRKK